MALTARRVLIAAGMLMATRVLGAVPVHAESATSGVPLPGLESDPANTVTAESCSVTLIDGTIKLDLTVQPDYDTPALMIHGPLFHWMGAAERYPDKNFPELEVRLDGRSLAPDSGYESFAGKTNITNSLRMAQMDPSAISRSPPVTPADATRPQLLKMLQNLGAIDVSGENYLARWSARRWLRFAIRPGVPSQHVVLSYKARPTLAVVTSDQLVTAAREADYCLFPDRLKLGKGLGVRWLAVSEYTIATGIDGNPPPTVQLSTSTTTGAASRRAWTFACAPGGKAIAATGSLRPQPVQVDRSGSLHVLMVAESSAPPAAAAAPSWGLRDLVAHTLE